MLIYIIKTYIYERCSYLMYIVGVVSSNCHYLIGWWAMDCVATDSVNSSEDYCLVVLLHHGGEGFHSVKDVSDLHCY